MTIQIPDAVQWLVPIVVGTSWPEGDEDALCRLAELWEQAAAAVGHAAEGGSAAARAARSAMRGEAADAFGAYWDRFAAGDAGGVGDAGGEQFLATLQQAGAQLAAGCAEAALDIEYAKLSIIAALLILAAQLAAMVAAAWATLGASTAGVPIGQAATRWTVQRIFQELIEQITLRTAVHAGLNVGVDGMIQGLQFAHGSRQSWDVGNTVDAGFTGLTTGAAAGGVGAAGRMLGAPTTRFGAAALHGAGEGALSGAAGNAVDDLAHGDTPSLQSLGSGAVSGGVAGALDGTVNRHRGLDQTWFRPEGSDHAKYHAEYAEYTAGPNTRGWRFTTPDGAEVRANVDNPYTGSWNSGGAQHIPPYSTPNSVPADEGGQQLPTADHVWGASHHGCQPASGA